MAIVQNPIIGRSKGSFGNAVFSKWKGKNTLRSKALEVANPQTDLQMKQRAKFAILVALYRQMAAILKIGFREMAVGMSEFNAFQSTNLKNDFLGWSGSAWVADHDKLVVSKGSLDATSIAVPTVTNASATVTVTFDSTPAGNQSAADTIYCIVMQENGDLYTVLSGARSTGTLTGSLPDKPNTGDLFYFYLFGVSPDGRKVSDNDTEIKLV